MDPQTMLIGAAAFLVTFILVYLISVFGMHEKSFEEVIEEQRKREEELTQKNRSEKKGQKKPWRRRQKASKKTEAEEENMLQDKSAQVSEPEPVQKMVELEIEPEIIQPVQAAKSEGKAKKKKSKELKPILINKEDPSFVRAGPTEEVYHAPITPKDEVELKHEHLFEAPAPAAAPKKSESPAPKSSEESAHDSTPEPTTTTTKKSKKSKAKVETGGGEGDFAVPTNGRLASSVKAANLNEMEIQALIDILLNKQLQQGGDTEEWTKKSQKGDPMFIMKKRLEEKEKQLAEELSIATSTNSKVQSMSQEMVKEKQRYTTLEKRTKEKVETQQAEIHALHARMQQSHDQHMAEVNALKIRLAEMDAQRGGAGSQDLIIRMKEENQKLKEAVVQAAAQSQANADLAGMKQQVQIMQNEISNNSRTINSLQNTKRTLEQTVSRKDEQIRKLEANQESDSVVSKRLSEVGDELRKAQNKNNALAKEIDESKAALQNAEKDRTAISQKLQDLQNMRTGADRQVGAMQSQLKEADKLKGDLESHVKTVENQLAEMERKQAEKDRELQQLRQENMALSSELKTTVERSQGEGQEAPPTKPAGATNGNHAVEEGGINKAEHEKIVNEKLKELLQLQEDLSSKDVRISQITEELEKQRKKNNELEEERQSVEESAGGRIQQVSVELSHAREEVLAKDAELQHLREEFNKSLEHSNELQSKVDTTSQPDTSAELSELKNQLEIVNKELESRTKETNELREKNVQAAEALRQAEKAAEEKQKESKSDTIEIEDAKGVLQRIFPSITVTGTVTQKEWIKIFEQHATKYVTEIKTSQETKSTNSKDLEYKLDQAVEYQSTLQSQVQHYKKVLSDTEGILLQLQSSVESEEKKWEGKLTASQQELEQAKEEIKKYHDEVRKAKGSRELEEKIDTLETRLTVTEQEKDRVQSELDQTRKDLEKSRDTSSQVAEIGSQSGSNSSSPTQKEVNEAASAEKSDYGTSV